MKTFPRLLRELPKKVTGSGLVQILDSYIKISKQNLPYFKQLSIDESMRLLLSTWFLNNQMEESAEDLKTTDKIYLMVVLEKSDEVGSKTCEDCDGDGKISCEYCNGGSDVCDECSGNGKIACDDCDGNGVDEEGEECSECDGDGELECPECDNGYIECEECQGLGEFECGECEGDGIIEVESSINYAYYVYILTRMSQVKDIENYIMVNDEIKLPYFSWNSITLDEIEDFKTPFKIYHLSEISLEDFKMNLLDSPFKSISNNYPRHVQNGSRIHESFIRRLKNYISDGHYT